MKNRYEVCGPVTRIWIDRRNGEVYEALIDTEDFGLVSGYTWSKSTPGYARHSKTGMPMHRLIMGAPEDKVVDHLNGSRMDNRKSNLRITTQLVNNHNRRIRPANVHFASQIKKWRVKFQYDYRAQSFGCYDTKEEAEAVAAQIRAKLLRGEPIIGNHRLAKAS